MKEMTNDIFLILNFISKKNNRTSVSDADREIPTLRSTDNAGNEVYGKFSALSVYLRVGIGIRCLIIFLLLFVKKLVGIYHVVAEGEHELLQIERSQSYGNKTVTISPQSILYCLFPI